MAKVMKGVFTANCGFCKKVAALPAKGMDSFMAALIRAGWKVGIRGAEAKTACPTHSCQKDLKGFCEEGIIQDDLPGIDPEEKDED